jgi:hypothetical protein
MITRPEPFIRNRRVREHAADRRLLSDTAYRRERGKGLAVLRRDVEDQWVRVDLDQCRGSLGEGEGASRSAACNDPLWPVLVLHATLGLSQHNTAIPRCRS